MLVYHATLSDDFEAEMDEQFQHSVDVFRKGRPGSVFTVADGMSPREFREWMMYVGGRSTMVCIDISGCEDDDFEQGDWLPSEVVIHNMKRAHVVWQDPMDGNPYIDFAHFIRDGAPVWDD